VNRIRLHIIFVISFIAISSYNFAQSHTELKPIQVKDSLYLIKTNENFSLKESNFKEYTDSLKKAFLFKQTVKIESITEIDEFKDTSIFTWKLDDIQNLEVLNDVDTNVYNFQKTNELEQKGGFFGYLGNVGNSAYSYDFKKRIKSTDYFVQNHLSWYLRKAEDLNFYNTKKRYTQFDYTNSQSSKSESQQTIGLLHSQNVNKDLNFGIDYKGIMSKGQYVNQEVKNHSIGIQAAYTGKKYTVYLQSVRNRHKEQINGGIIQDTIVESGKETYWYDRRTREISSKYSNPQTENGLNNIRIVQEYKMQVPDFLKNESKRGQKPNTIFSVKHRFNYLKQYRVFSEASLEDSLSENMYHSNLLTYDSTYYSSVTNRIQFEIKENNYLNSAYRLFGGITWKHDKLFVEDSNVFVFKQNDKKYNSYAYYVGGNGNYKERINYRYYYNQFFVGERAGETDLVGDLDLRFGKKKNLILNGGIEIDINKPDYLIENYFSNHIKWNKNFDNVVNTKLKASVEERNIDVKLGIQIDKIDNFIYFDTLKMAQQAKNSQNVLSAYVSNRTKFWHLEWENKLNYQQVDGNAVRVPEILVYESLTFNKKIFKGVLDLRAGVEMYYHSAFNANDFDPVSGQFYHQEETQIGNYPVFNVFVIGKLSRARLLFKYEHVNSGLFPDPNYFSIPNYPIGQRMIRWGISWTFYD
jgi:hypothetical protein